MVGARFTFVDVTDTPLVHSVTGSTSLRFDVREEMALSPFRDSAPSLSEV